MREHGQGAQVEGRRSLLPWRCDQKGRKGKTPPPLIPVPRRPRTQHPAAPHTHTTPNLNTQPPATKITPPLTGPASSDTLPLHPRVLISLILSISKIIYSNFGDGIFDLLSVKENRTFERLNPFFCFFFGFLIFLL